MERTTLHVPNWKCKRAGYKATHMPCEASVDFRTSDELTVVFLSNLGSPADSLLPEASGF
jgi:hypothetical protein